MNSGKQFGLIEWDHIMEELKKTGREANLCKRQERAETYLSCLSPSQCITECMSQNSYSMNGKNSSVQKGTASPCLGLGHMITPDRAIVSFYLKAFQGTGNTVERIIEIIQLK